MGLADPFVRLQYVEKKIKNDFRRGDCRPKGIYHYNWATAHQQHKQTLLLVENILLRLYFWKI